MQAFWWLLIKSYIYAWFLFQYIDKVEEENEEYKAEIKKKDAAIKGLQEILKRQQLRQEEVVALQKDQ